MRRALGLHPLGDWTDDARDLVVFPQDAYPEHAGSHDYTRAVLNAGPPPRARHRAPRRTPPLALAFLAGVLAFSFTHDASSETWRGLVIAPEHCCAPYDKKSDSPRTPGERDIVR